MSSVVTDSVSSSHDDRSSPYIVRENIHTPLWQIIRYMYHIMHTKGIEGKLNIHYKSMTNTRTCIAITQNLIALNYRYYS